MKKHAIKTLSMSLTAMLLTLPSAGNANVWAPADDRSIFFTLEALLGKSSTDDDTFGIFEDTADIHDGTGPLLSFMSGTNVSFTKNGLNFDISNDNSSATLLGSNRFQIGWQAPGNIWMLETASISNTLLGNSVWQLTFNSDDDSPNDGKHLYAVGVSQSSEIPSNVPIPAALWLFASGLIGLFGVRFTRIRG